MSPFCAVWTTTGTAALGPKKAMRPPIPPAAVAALVCAWFTHQTTPNRTTATTAVSTSENRRRRGRPLAGGGGWGPGLDSGTVTRAPSLELLLIGSGW